MCVGAELEDVNELQGWLIPLLLRRGGRATKKMVPFRKGADGVVARESRFAVRFETFARERPPRLRRIRRLRDFFIDAAATPPHEEGNARTVHPRLHLWHY
jgi:hypothetical protein